MHLDPITASTVLAAASNQAPSWTDVWQAWGSVVAAGAGVLTLLTAVAAAVVALGQLNEARRVRREQAQAYVVVYAQALDRISPKVIEIIIENVGTTGAHGVTITSTPPLQRSAEQAPEVILSTPIPFLAPRQQLRTYWDNTEQRSRNETLPDKHEVAVTFTDTFKEKHTDVFVLDWAIFGKRMFTVEKTTHHAAKALEDIAGTLKKRSSRREDASRSSFRNVEITRCGACRRRARDPLSLSACGAALERARRGAA